MQDAATGLLSSSTRVGSSSSEPSDHEERTVSTTRWSKEGKTSRFLGVSLTGSSEGKQWWTAQLHKHRRKIRIGYSYATEEAAARAYDRAYIAVNGRGHRTNFSLDHYPEETEHVREGEDLDLFLESLRRDVNPEGVDGVPHVAGWVPPATAAFDRMLEGRKRRLRTLDAAGGASSPPADSGVAAVDTSSSLETQLQTAGAAARDSSPDAKAADPIRRVQALEKDLFEAQHGVARIAAETAGPLHLHARPPPPPPVRPARVSYTELLRRFQLDAAANRMSSFRDPSDTDSDPESADHDGPATDAAPGKQPECWVCRSKQHSAQRCPVMWLAGGAHAQPGSSPDRTEHDPSDQRPTDDCPWLAHVPGGVKDMMDAMQQHASDAANQQAFGSRSRSVKHSFSPEALLAAALLVDESMQAAAAEP